jgi:hypothetical protein
MINKRFIGGLLRKPQMTRKEIKFIVNLGKEYEQIVEIGSGMSTLIWAKAFKSVIAIESRIQWYRKINKVLIKKSVKNVNLLFAAPESCAFSKKGEELWNSRVPTDYGTVKEFELYFDTTQTVLDQLSTPAVILIDGHIREQIAMYCKVLSLDHALLLHDFSNDRTYLNEWVSTDCKIMTVVDSLVQFKAKNL